MKTKQLIFLFTFYLFASSLFAQAGKFNVGVELFSGLSDYSGEERGGIEYLKKPSFAIGVVASYQFNSNASFESGLTYVNKDHLEDRSGTYFSLIDVIEWDVDDKYLNNYNYLSVPLNIRLSLNDNFDKGFYLRFGVSADFFLSAKTKHTYKRYNREKQTEEYSNDTDIRKTHLNVNGGLGYSFLLSNKLQLSVEPAFETMLYRMYHKGNFFNYNSAGIKLRCIFL